ncbi:MAG: DUF2189 domain-containing protein [Methylocystis sp.]|jgi:uncharacterized membrane protein|nr:DUF2189 domain-containing protein [Methylocystis sp.]MCA3585068.1 DUF2189 domain-containing protein [Methylocystis sp.]MCA3587785.1 DUF2189 domain-containing protein [Methylocystis sp.]MCA3592286.1 DUF2189 domain-containing protein [Methylocystis sp.]
MNAKTEMAIQPATPATVTYRTLTVGDLVSSLKAGLADFAAAPAFGLFFGLFYALAGCALVSLAAYFGQYMVVLPLIMGFALIGPFAAVGLYEVSRRLEAGLPLSFPIVLGVIRQQSTRQIMMLGFALMVLMLFWVRVALLIYALNFGLKPVNPMSMGVDVMFGSSAVTFLLTGTIVGAGFAFVAFAISVFSFPHLLAKEQDFISAIILSLKGVMLNLPVMIIWGIIVGALLFLAATPFFLGLLVVLPILGHATWHLYRKAIGTA